MADIDTNVTDIITDTPKDEVSEAVDSTELAKLKAELAKQKAALDKATKEAGDAKKALRAKQSAEEIAAEEKRIADEERDKELNELRKRFAVAESSKKIMTFVGDESVSSSVAEALYGAEDVDAAIDAFNKAWMAKEKKLRIEFGRLPAPGAGSSEGNTTTKDQLDNMTYTERIKFANEHPDEYERLMGRK
jgi:hypothetical protein